MHDIALHIDDAPVVRLHIKGICNREGGEGRFFFSTGPS